MIFISIPTIKFFYPIYTSTEVIIPYGLHPFDICSANPELWNAIKLLYIFTFIFSNFVISRFIYIRIIQKVLSLFSKKMKNTSLLSEDYKTHSQNFVNSLYLKIGLDEKTNTEIYIPESGLYQNFLITGTIGSGKTSSAMYPFTRQLLKYNKENPNSKIGMLILDVKGNYYKQIRKYAESYDLSDDLIVIELGSNVFYNPLHKPNLKPQVLANRLKTILLLFSENNTESYWLDKAEEVLCECIKLCRLYNNGYVTFVELHKLITNQNYYKEKLQVLRNLFISSKLNSNQIYELTASINFFEKEFQNLDDRTKGILVSEITRITNTFVSDYDVMQTFCSPKKNLTFKGFNEVIKKR